MQGLYGMGLTGEMSISEIRRKQQQMERFGNQAQGIFGSSMFRPQTETSTFNNGGYSGSMGSPSMPYSSTMMGRSSMSSLGGSSSFGSPYSSTSNWSSMGNAPRFPYSGMTGGY
jgi:hypothetical protein